MNVLVGVSILLCIYLGGAVSTVSHLVVRMSFDGGMNCSMVNKTLLSIYDGFIREQFQKEHISTYDQNYQYCGCILADSTCFSKYNTPQLTLRYNLTDASDNSKSYTSFNFSITEIDISRKDGANYLLCATVTPSSPDSNTCEQQFEKQTQTQTQPHPQTQKQPHTLTRTQPQQQQQQQAQEQEQSKSDTNIGLIVGPIMAALAVLGAIPALYYMYRRLKKNQVDNDSDNDITPIVPSDFGITDAPNSIAPAGT